MNIFSVYHACLMFHVTAFTPSSYFLLILIPTFSCGYWKYFSHIFETVGGLNSSRDFEIVTVALLSICIFRNSPVKKKKLTPYLICSHLSQFYYKIEAVGWFVLESVVPGVSVARIAFIFRISLLLDCLTLKTKTSWPCNSPGISQTTTQRCILIHSVFCRDGASHAVQCGQKYHNERNNC